MIGAPTGGSLGISGQDEDRRVIARGAAFSAGQIMQFDLARSNAATTNATPGDPNSCLVNVVTVQTGGNKFGLLCAAMETIAQDRKGRARLRGLAKLYVVKSAGDIHVGDGLYAVAGQRYLTANPGAGDRLVAIAQENVTAPTTATLCNCLFDLINGVGTFVS